ncbi:DUF2062 domain-containing protein [Parasulfuritortus cantonensis]|uniref:DUF2062 domain-containing protein n=1 Tax=Parasulfuritortus cantonensis TaxID=2528202 RepID=A0A4R1B1B0_9PROT|nr:DUF2062 domain-containing protein [Parasulfuritortus cantonensis]TCJ11784.1 DUF2062 domain-containing protein [Parasulfuritortus cantonensis]
MPRKHFRKFLPDHATIREHRHLKLFQPLLRHPNLWHLNRHSVAGGVAAGLFAGLIPGPVQMLSGAILAIIFRVNLPVAMVTTWYTNPFTWGPLIVAAYWLGSLFTGETIARAIPPDFDWGGGQWSNYLPELWLWFKNLGETYLIGSVALGLLLAALGYVGVQLAWRLYILAYLRRRKRRAQART